MFQDVLHRRLSMGTIMDLDTIAELNEPPVNVWKFTNEIRGALQSTSKLYGFSPTNFEGYKNESMFYTILFDVFTNSYNPDINGDFDINKIEEGFLPQKFVVGSDETPLPFVGGSRQGELDGVTYQEIVSVFGEPSHSEPSGDNKVQVEWDIKFDNGVRASIYDYKQYNMDPKDIDFWSIGGNSESSAAEVYKSMGLIKPI